MTGDGSITLLHISDLQFGRHHRFGNLAAGDPDAHFDSLFGRLSDDLFKLGEQGMRPELIVVSGDLTEQGLRKEFDDAHEFLAQLCAALKLPPRRVVLVPGNHDINWTLCEVYFNECDETGKERRIPYWPKWDPYAQMFDRFFSEEPDITFTEAEPWSFWEMSDLKLVVTGLNSTYSESHKKEDHFGFLGEEQMRAVAERLRPYQEDGWFRLGVVHHNVSRAPVNDDENLRDAEALGEILGPSLNLLLHGHIHSSKMSWLGQGPLPVISTGSAALGAEARPAEVPNQFQLVRLEAGELTRWTRSYAPDRNKWIADPRSSPDGNEWQVKCAISFASAEATFDRTGTEAQPEPGPSGVESPAVETDSAAQQGDAELDTGRLAASLHGVLSELQQAVHAEGRGVLISGPEGTGKTCLLETLLASQLAQNNLNLVPVRFEGQANPLQALRLALQFRFGGNFIPDDTFELDRLPPALPEGTVLLVDNADSDAATEAVLWLRERFREVPAIVTRPTSDTTQLPGFVPIELRGISEADAWAMLKDFDLDAAIAVQIIARAAGNPQKLRQQAAAARAGADGSRDPVKTMHAEWPRPALRSLWLIAMLPSSILSYELLGEVGGFDQRALDLIEDYGMGEAVARGESASRYVSVHRQLTCFCRDAIIPGVASNDLRELTGEAVNYYVNWLSSGPPVEAIDAAYDNLMYLLDRVEDPHLRADLAVALIGDSLDDPTGYMPSRGLAHMLREKRRRTSLEQTAQEVGSLRAGPIFKNLGLFLHRANEVGAEYLLRKAKDAYNGVGDERGSTSATWLLGSVTEDSGDREGAVKLFRESRTNTTDPELHALSHHLEGCAKYHWEDFDGAHRSFKDARKNEAILRPKILLRIDRGLAYVELAQANERTQEVERKLAKLRDEAEELGLPREAARCTRHIGKAQLGRDDLEAATRSLEEARADFIRLGDLRGLGATLCDLATTLRKREQYYEAADKAKDSLDIAKGKDGIRFPMKSPIGVARAEIELAEIELAQGGGDHVDERLRAACNILETIRHPRAVQLMERLGMNRRDAPFPKVKGVLFDIVDTLAVVSPQAYENAKEDISNALDVDHALFKEAWAKSRETASTRADWTPRERIKWVAGELNRDLSEKELDDLAKKEVDIWTSSIRVDPSAKRTLQTLKENDMKVALVTNGSSAMRDLSTILELDEYVDASLLSCEVANLKPEAAIYEEAARRLGLRKENCMYVGDGSDRELEGAMEVEMFAVRMIGHRHQRPQYSTHDSLNWNATVSSLDELLVRMGLLESEEMNGD